ncbi:transposase [Streptomyces sp. AM2-3-1]|uniref:transposase n=1 Tax=Streptomyces sp. AM2-3-1 TaxID=3075824 RepID=UPI0028C417E9|nr:transposase [Streptomyces sp. AM2-3-1]WNO69353.1 transposase [Streptomyces sp. AM2-3-1]
MLPAQPEPVQALGIDEIRRGRPRWIPDEATGIWQTAVDRWHVGFVDLSGKQGLLGQVEGRTAQAVITWLADRDQAWRDAVRYVAVDMCTIFKSAIRRVLPQATLVVDHFHLVQLANQPLTEVRRRVTVTHRGRRGPRATASGNCATGSPAPPPGCAASTSTLSSTSCPTCPG